MKAPTNAEMIEQWKNGKPDEFTKCNFALVAALMHFGLPDATQLDIYDKMKVVLDEHPDHAETVMRILRIGWNGLFEHGIRAPAPDAEGDYTITLQLKVQGRGPYGTDLRVGYPRIDKRWKPQLTPKKGRPRRTSKPS